MYLIECRRRELSLSGIGDDKGVGLFLLYALIMLPLDSFREVAYEQAIKGNHCIENSVDCPIASRYRFLCFT